MAIMDEDGCTNHDPPSPISGELVSFDPNGDLYLHVGAGVEEKTKTYFVCSKALARASTVFRKMLYGGFAESGHSDVDHGWTVDLPEDRQQPMEMMLNIVHGAFDKVPEKIELTELYTFLVVTEKYDATNITRPWAKGWMEGVKTSMQNPLLLGVAYELGDYQTFNAMAMKIATECHLDHEEDLVFGFAGENRESYTYKLKNLDCLIPDGLLDDAASIRKTLLIAMLDPYLNLYAALKGGDRCMSSPGDPSGGKRCDSLLLGSLIRSFATQNLDLTANDPVKAYRGSASHLQSVMLKLELYTIHSGYAHPTTSSFSFGQTAPSRFGFSMSACEHVLQSGLREGVERSLMLRGNMSFAQPKHKEYLTKQARPTTPVVLEEFGDLQLRVGSDHTGQTTIFLVCSRTVARSSPVLKRMLYGGFAESLSAQTKKENWVVDLPDDRPDSFKIFLHVMHGHFDQVPSRTAIDNLYLLLVLLDKYDSIGLIRPWAKPWLKGIKTSESLPLALYIAWNLGHKETFQSKMTKIIHASFIDEQGSLSYEQNCRSKETGAWSVHHIKLAADLDNWGPSDALDTIREMRHKLVSIQFEPYIQLYKSLISEQGLCRYRARVKPYLLEAGMRCDSVALGSMIRECLLQGIDIMAQDPVEAHRGPVRQLEDKLAALKIFVGESNDKTEHSICRRNLTKYRDNISADNERKTAEALVLKPQYQARMEAQAKKTGICDAR
ncbi:nuclear pore protein-like protein [Colletotrichum chrysophilum]|uniref:Nuclear pore protein-like protein n=1 Tax=Colletotrichum chrysophilum TaxID=1836956 RepID=A0AAD9A8Q3_9PEZI|nr:nuclear pore protein-like protein [Colletotrichum chrysophilum]